MSVTPRGMSIQEAYRLYRDNNLFVNRRYQRKLVWTESEKASLIDSVLRGFPIPLILLAERPRDGGIAKFEIIDGVQRLNSVFSFVENAYPLNNMYFDIKEFARAKQISEQNIFQPALENLPRLSPQQCADFLDYQLAVTIYPATTESEITEVFGRINSGGRQLSDQEKRQAGLLTPFADLVRSLSAEIRGDPSKELLLLAEMPEISVDSKRARQGYGLVAEDTFWCKQGILWNTNLRDSEDEELIADIAVSILQNTPFARSKESLDDLYNPNSDSFKKTEATLAAYPQSRLIDEMKATFSVLQNVIETSNSDVSALRNVVNPGSRNPIKASFYAIYMAFFDLVIRKELSPADPNGIMNALKNLQQDMQRSAHFTTTEDRVKNIDKTIGLVQKFFVRREPPALRHGAGLILDFENSLRRSSIETPRYEFKQGFLRLSNSRDFDNGILTQILETICGIANVGPDANGYVFIGIVDKPNDANRIADLDSITPIQVGQRYVVGTEREARLMRKTPDQYMEILTTAIRSSNLGETLKKQVLSQIDVIDYRGLMVVRITVPAQDAVSFLGDQAYARESSSTVALRGPGLLAINALFAKYKNK